ncbi:MAG: hypothetical protein Q8J64_09110 [Thermodesulfovibrionales bacterium]|nr:hypothetical protein [Thermodesulfovibrionales bacterium]
MSLSYAVSKDEISLKICPVKGKPNKKIGPFKLWWDKEGKICGLSIENFIKEQEEFEKDLSASRRRGVEGKSLLVFEGIIPAGDLKLMAMAVEEGCEKVDVGEW